MRPITNTSNSSLKPISNTNYTCSLSWRFVSSFLVASWIRTLRSLATTVQNELAQELKLQEFQESLKTRTPAIVH
jgi:hypothetical protein